jgi:hypothetical protein
MIENRLCEVCRRAESRVVKLSSTVGMRVLGFKDVLEVRPYKRCSIGKHAILKDQVFLKI